MTNIKTTKATKAYNSKILGVDVPVEIEEEVMLDFNEQKGTFVRTSKYVMYANGHMIGYRVYRLTEDKEEEILADWGNTTELVDGIYGAFRG